MHCNYLRRTSKWILLPLTIEMECRHFKPKTKSIHGGRTLRFSAFSLFFPLSYRIIYWHKFLRGNNVLNVLFNHAVFAAAFRYVRAKNSLLLYVAGCFTNAGSGEFIKSFQTQRCVRVLGRIFHSLFLEGGLLPPIDCTFSNLFRSVVFVIKFDEWSLSSC